MPREQSIQFLRYKSDEWKIDKNCILLTGDSAGGCSTLWIACHDDLADPDSADPVERESTRVQGATMINAQVSINPKILKEWLGETYAYHEMIVKCVGTSPIDEVCSDYARYEPVYEGFSPINSLTQDDPPIYMSYNGDLSLPATSFGHAIHHGMFSLKFKEKSKSVGHNHVYFFAGKTYTSTYSSTRDFLVKAAGGIINEAE